jgi:hypothetical protein
MAVLDSTMTALLSNDIVLHANVRPQTGGSVTAKEPKESTSTSILPVEQTIVSCFKFGERVSAFQAAYFSFSQGEPLPCLLYVTFSGQLVVYVDVRLNKRVLPHTPSEPHVHLNRYKLCVLTTIIDIAKHQKNENKPRKKAMEKKSKERKKMQETQQQKRDERNSTNLKNYILGYCLLVPTRVCFPTPSTAG